MLGCCSIRSRATNSLLRSEIDIVLISVIIIVFHSDLSGCDFPEFQIAIYTQVWGSKIKAKGLKFEQKSGGGFASRFQNSGDVSKYAQLLFGSNSYSATSLDLT